MERGIEKLRFLGNKGRKLNRSTEFDTVSLATKTLEDQSSLKGFPDIKTLQSLDIMVNLKFYDSH